MKLLIVAALIAVTSAARLENLQRSYLPPDNNNIQAGVGTNGFGPNGAPGAVNGFAKARLGNGFNGFARNGFNGNGANGRGSNGFAVAGPTANGNGAFSQSTIGSDAEEDVEPIGPNAFSTNVGRNGAAAASTQYLPPNQGPAGPGFNGFNFGRSPIKPACATCGTRFGNQGQPAVPAPAYGVPQFGAAINTPNGSAFAAASSPTGSDAPTDAAPTGNFGPGSVAPQGANRQYLAPSAPPQNPPQQPFDDRSGYIY